MSILLSIITLLFFPDRLTAADCDTKGQNFNEAKDLMYFSEVVVFGFSLCLYVFTF